MHNAKGSSLSFEDQVPSELFSVLSLILLTLHPPSDGTSLLCLLSTFPLLLVGLSSDIADLHVVLGLGPLAVQQLTCRIAFCQVSVNVPGFPFLALLDSSALSYPDPS